MNLLRKGNILSLVKDKKDFYLNRRFFYLKKASFSLNTYKKRIEWMSWGFWSYNKYMKKLGRLLLTRAQFTYGSGLTLEKRPTAGFLFNTVLMRDKWRTMLRIEKARRKYKIFGLVVRATLNNFFITVIDRKGYGNVLCYLSAGQIEPTLAVKRRSLFVAKIVAKKIVARLRRKFYYHRRMYVFCKSRLCKRTVAALRIFSEFKYFVYNIFFLINKSHNGLRPPKQRRVKKKKKKRKKKK